MLPVPITTFGLAPHRLILLDRQPPKPFGASGFAPSAQWERVGALQAADQTCLCSHSAQPSRAPEAVPSMMALGAHQHEPGIGDRQPTSPNLAQPQARPRGDWDIRSRNGEPEGTPSFGKLRTDG